MSATAGCTMLGDLKEFVDENGDLMLDMLQLTLMACGLIPVYGEVCDGIDAAVSFSRDDWIGGLLSAGAAVPLLGYLATAGKSWNNSDEIRDILKLVEDSGPGRARPAGTAGRVRPTVADRKLENYVEQLRDELQFAGTIQGGMR